MSDSPKQQPGLVAHVSQARHDEGLAAAKDALGGAKAALAFKLSHADISRYNAVQKLLYAGVILCGILIVLVGITLTAAQTGQAEEHL